MIPVPERVRWSIDPISPHSSPSPKTVSVAPEQKDLRPARQLISVGGTHNFEITPPRPLDLCLEKRRGNGEWVLQAKSWRGELPTATTPNFSGSHSGVRMTGPEALAG
ncbi:hypothetical protein CBM2597_U10298 [Cupriavidus taiwanensis]|uniref:Uncharacterized protein n=1 Tax=Cupriavidus taiwanensis TaxID=164546 RepID=A0A7Z7NPS1_9BURK|nr:hypothetical protein CBM2597_U10298 [Cupriavidus taiwanensis]SPC25501.1 hypothetical protein CBM2594_U10002 [Cupriavidus taiwanensis]